jgi:hypothetical protein
MNADLKMPVAGRPADRGFCEALDDSSPKSAFIRAHLCLKLPALRG